MIAKLHTGSLSGIDAQRVVVDSVGVAMTLVQTNELIAKYEGINTV